jgi:hypothetical protein
MRETMLTEFASRVTTIRRYLAEYRSWISSKLGCRIEDTVLLELDFPIVQAAACHVLSGVRLHRDDSRTIGEVRKLARSEFASRSENLPAASGFPRKPGIEICSRGLENRLEGACARGKAQAFQVSAKTE